MSFETYGNYQLLRRLATGGMAQIYLARRVGVEGFEKLFVVKRILPHLAENDDFVQMFLDEARIAARLNHPNIVQIFDLGAQDDSYFIAMEYIHGEDVRRIWKRATSLGAAIPIWLVCRVIMDACSGLDYAHKKVEGGKPLGIIHRDISPQNILVSFEGGVKVVDFGIAKAHDQATVTKSGVLKGKYAYMSPEQAGGKRDLDARSDIFALGIVLYELLTSARLFKRANEIQTLNAVSQCSVIKPSKVNPQIPPDLDAIVMRALAKNPDQRYQEAVQLQLDLESWLLTHKLPSSSAKVAAYMQELYADRLAREAEEGKVVFEDPSAFKSNERDEPPPPLPKKQPRPEPPAALPRRDSSQEPTVLAPPDFEGGAEGEGEGTEETLPSSRHVDDGVEEELDSEQLRSLSDGASPRRSTSFPSRPAENRIPTTPERPRNVEAFDPREASRTTMHRSTPWVVFVGAAVLLATIGLQLFWDRLAPPREPTKGAEQAVPAPDAQASPTATDEPPAVLEPWAVVEIASEPSGATVRFDGKELTSKTPCTLPPLPAGTYRLELAKSGFVGYMTQVTIPSTGQVRLPTIPLIPDKPVAANRPPLQVAAPDAGVQQRDAGTPVPAAPPAKVHLTLKTVPPGASVYVGGKALGPAPVSLEAQPSAALNVQAMLAGYFLLEKKVKVGSGGSQTVELKLEEKGKPGTTSRADAGAAPAAAVGRGQVRFIVTPWADVACDGQPFGQTPFAEKTLPSGTYDCSFTHPELGTRRQQVEVRSNEITRVTVQF